MNKQREALELALAALCYDNSLSRGATIVAVREALAEPEQEPTTDGELYAAFLMGLQ